MSRELIDTETGEILTLDKGGRIQTSFKIATNGYYGVDCKLIEDCVTADSLKHSISFIDSASVFSNTDYDSQYVVDLVTTNNITPSEAKLLDFLVSNVSKWNFVFTNTTELDKIDTMSRRRLSSLADKGLVKVDHTDKPFKGDRVIRINPVVCFDGWDLIRESKIKDWYSHSNLVRK